MIRRFQLIACLTALMITMPQVAVAYTYELVISGSELIKQGKSALRAGRLDAAIRIYNFALNRHISSRDVQRAHNDLCVAYYFKRDFAVAMDHCNTAIELSPNEWVAYNNRANIYLETDRFELALNDYQKGLALSPQSEVLRTNINIAYRRMEGTPIAIDALRGDPAIPEQPLNNDQVGVEVAGR